MIVYFPGIALLALAIRSRPSHLDLFYICLIYWCAWYIRSICLKLIVVVMFYVAKNEDNEIYESLSDTERVLAITDIHIISISCQ